MERDYTSCPEKKHPAEVGYEVVEAMPMVRVDIDQDLSLHQHRASWAGTTQMEKQPWSPP